MSPRIDKVFKSIADPTRREIFHVVVLATTALSITQISERFEMTRQGVTKHINLLRDAGLITMSTQGRERFCLANPEPLRLVRDWLGFYEQFWDEKLTSLDQHLDRKSQK